MMSKSSANAQKIAQETLDNRIITTYKSQKPAFLKRLSSNLNQIFFRSLKKSATQIDCAVCM